MFREDTNHGDSGEWEKFFNHIRYIRKQKKCFVWTRIMETEITK